MTTTSGPVPGAGTSPRPGAHDDPPRVAIVHERFLVPAGSERIVEQWHARWPDAPIFAAICDESSLLPGLRDADIRPTMLQSIYLGRGRYAHTLPLLPLAFSRLDLGAPDVVLVSHHAFAQRVRPPEHTTVISYVHTPARWMWDADLLGDEAGGATSRMLLRAFARTQRRRDRLAAQRPDVLVANSSAVRERIQRWWGRDAVVVHPPVDVARYTADPAVVRGDFFLYAGRLVPYKRPEVAVAAARKAGVPIVVAGAGRSERAVRAAAGPGVELLGQVDDDTLRDLYRRCRALLHPGIEDFGIVAVEAQAAGAPVIARDDGGARDSVVDGVTGARYTVESPADEVDSLVAAIRAFDAGRVDPVAMRTHAEKFSIDRFVDRFDAVVADALRSTA